MTLEYGCRARSQRSSANDCPRYDCTIVRRFWYPERARPEGAKTPLWPLEFSRGRDLSSCRMLYSLTLSGAMIAPQRYRASVVGVQSGQVGTIQGEGIPSGNRRSTVASCRFCRSKQISIRRSCRACASKGSFAPSRKSWTVPAPKCRLGRELHLARGLPTAVVPTLARTQKTTRRTLPTVSCTRAIVSQKQG